MPVERFFIDQELKEGMSFFLEKEEFHHLAHVVRIKPQETIELINGKGALASALIESIERHQAKARVLSCKKEPSPSYELILAQAIPRQPRLEYIVEKSVELGITKLCLFPGELSEKKTLSPSQIERVNHILISAMKQCGRLFIPELVLAPSILSWNLSSLPTSCFFGDTRQDAPLFFKALQERPKSVLIAIGPEKGFHTKEVSCMETTLHMQGVHLHSNILRTDTAAICALSLASAYLLGSP